MADAAAPTTAALSSAPTDAPPPSASGSPCQGAALKLEDIYVDECLLQDLPPESKQPPKIALEIVAKDSYIQSYSGTVSVAFVNRSGKEVDMIFEHRCLFEKASHLFDLEATNGRGARAMLDQQRPPVGMIGALNVDCPNPYVRAKVPAEGRITIEIPFRTFAVAQIGPGLPPGELAPGVYSVEITTPLVRHPRLKGRFRLNLKPL